MISVFGSINMDLIATTTRLPRPGETVHGDSFSTAPGGKGANQALAATRAGAITKMAGAVGQDNFATPALELLKSAGTNLDFVKSVDGPTGTALILVGGDAENMIAVIAGANGQVTVSDVDPLLDSMHRGDSLLLQMEIGIDAVEAALRGAQTRGIRSVFNIAPMSDNVIAIAPLADIIVANETEFDLLIGQGTLSSEERFIEMRNYHKKMQTSIVITLGGDGVIAIDQGHEYSAKGLTIEPIDTVGAGDTFCGYLTQGLDAGLDFGLALERAAIAGSLACLKAGAQPAIPTQADLAAL